jgi:hypothetical protein
MLDALGPPLSTLVKRVMSRITVDSIASGSDDEVFSALGHELEDRITSERGSPEFVAEIKGLPAGLRAMAATYELDVSLALDDLGWHFGNWHSVELAEETAAGLEELGAQELAELFRAAFDLAQDYWIELGAENWMEWYNSSALEKAVGPLNAKAWAIVGQKKNGIFSYWVEYARKYPERVGAEIA